VRTRQVAGQLELFGADGVVHVTKVHYRSVMVDFGGELVDRGWFTWSCSCGAGSAPEARSSHRDMAESKADRHRAGEF
jgi:hypothetical protein